MSLTQRHRGALLDREQVTLKLAPVWLLAEASSGQFLFGWPHKQLQPCLLQVVAQMAFRANVTSSKPDASLEVSVGERK